jgi:hypothetical protein
MHSVQIRLYMHAYNPNRNTQNKKTGALAGASAAAITTPFDLVRSRLMLQVYAYTRVGIYTYVHRNIDKEVCRNMHLNQWYVEICTPINGHRTFR